MCIRDRYYTSQKNPDNTQVKKSDNTQFTKSENTEDTIHKIQSLLRIVEISRYWINFL